MNVLSLFDGMSCGMIALDRLGIKVDNYYASEIDKYAIQVSQANYPDIIQVGDITKLDLSTLPKIDLVMGGSPCQGFSFAGKQLAFDDPRSALFFEFVKCVDTLKPKYFLLENVKMKKEYLDVISEYMGVEPIFINSSLVSAQSRQRYYWTNIPNVEQPKERGIVLRDILEDSNAWTHTPPQYLRNNLNGKPRGDRVKSTNQKASCLTATMYKGQIPTYIKQSVKDFNDNLDKMTTKDGKAYTLTTTYGAAGAKDSLEKKRRSMIPTSDKPQHIGTAVDIKGHDVLKRVYSPDGKSPTVNTCQGGNREPKVVAGAWRGRYQEDGSVKQKLHLNKQSKSYALTASFHHKMNFLTKDEVYWRKLTPLECERLQTVPDNYTNHVSNSQRYKMLGNGWTIEVIAHILKNIEVN